MDDPLADILSEGSNDSFFEDPKPLSKRSSLTKTPEKKSIQDIFNISDKPPELSSKRSDDWLGISSKESKSPAKTSKVAKKISFDDEDDILGNLGLSKRPPSKGEQNKGKKVDLLESILGKSEETEKKPSFDDIIKESKELGKNEDIFKTPTKSESLSGREGRRGRRSSGGLMDPLGLFNANESKREDVKPTQSKSTPNISDQSLPDWLGGTPAKQSKSEYTLTKEPQEEVQITEPPKEEEKTVTIEKQDQEDLTSILTQQKLIQSQVGLQNTAIALQQQESQLLVALQLKKYEENLAEMQLKQQELLKKQEEQFNLLLDRQFAKQQIMENNMKLQQERINNHIQMLIAQPGVYSKKQEVEELKKNADEENVKLYQNIIGSLKQRQHEEIFLLEESYKKQINLLEENLDFLEKRLKQNAEKITESFEEKIKLMQLQHDEELRNYKQKIQDLESQHLEEIKQLRDNNARLIEEIKYEHSLLLDNIKEAKKSETSLFQDSSSYLQKLDNNIEILYSNSKNLLDLKEKVEKDYGILSKAREESLKAKEQEIISMRITLEKCRESAEKERSELLALVRALETKLSEQNQNAREERWAFQQAANTLAARSAALDREAEFNRASIEREREQLKTIRESIFAEQEKLMLQLTEEKLAISAEKSRLETSSKLKSNYDSQKAKTEMEAAIQIAKEAAEMTDRERECLQREKCEVEKIKRNFKDQEKKLVLKEIELENMMRDAEIRKNEGDKAIAEAKSIENKYNERLRELQSQLILLSNREKKLAEEKMALSKERVALTLMAKNQKCGLCCADPEKLDENDLNFMNAQYFNIDNDILRLRMEANDNNVPK